MSDTKSTATPKPPLVSLATDEQNEGLKKIELAVDILKGSKIPFIIFAAPTSSLTKDLVFGESHCFSYSEDNKTYLEEIGYVMDRLLGIVLKFMSRRLKGGIAVYNEIGLPVITFQSGQALAVKDILEREAKKKGPEIVTKGL